MLVQPTPSQAPSAYHSYLVRMWQSCPEAPWRASVQSVQTGEAVHFTNLAALFAFLWAKTGVMQIEVAQTETEIIFPPMPEHREGRHE